MFWYDEIVYYFFDEYEEEAVPKTCEEGANVAVINVYGEIVGYAEDYLDGYVYTTSDEVLSYLDSINRNSNIEAIIVQIDSGGGAGFAGEEIRDALRRCEKLVIALIRGMGASAAYELAIGADKIYARETSEVGMTCPPKTGPDVKLGSGRKNFIGRQVDGTKKVLTGTDHPNSQRS